MDQSTPGRQQSGGSHRPGLSAGSGGCVVSLASGPVCVCVGVECISNAL